MVNKKHGLRIAAVLLILMFFLIPLLSSPVAAAFTFDVSTASTDNTPTGPTVAWSGANNPGSYSSFHSNPATATFQCTFSFRDTSGNPQMPSSRHYGELNVQKRPGGPILSANTGNIYLNSGGSWAGTLTVGDTYNAANLPVTWDIWVYVECEDLPTTTMAWNTWYWDYTVM